MLNISWAHQMSCRQWFCVNIKKKKTQAKEKRGTLLKKSVSERVQCAGPLLMSYLYKDVPYIWSPATLMASLSLRLLNTFLVWRASSFDPRPPIPKCCFQQRRTFLSQRKKKRGLKCQPCRSLIVFLSRHINVFHHIHVNPTMFFADWLAIFSCFV